MTDKQIVECHHLYYGKLLRHIVKLRDEDVNVFDVFVRPLIARLLEETEKRINNK